MMTISAMVLFIGGAVILFFFLRNLNLKANTKVRSEGPGKMQRIICGVSGAVALILVIWCTVRDYNKLYKYEKQDFEISMPTIEVKKLKHTDKVEKFRILTQFFAVDHETGRLLLFKEKILSESDNTMGVEGTAAKFNVEGNIHIHGIYWSDYNGYVNFNFSSRTSHGSGGFGFYDSGSFTQAKAARPMYSGYNYQGDTFFSMIKKRGAEIHFYTMISRLDPEDKLKKVDFGKVKPWLREGRGYTIYSSGETPFMVLADEGGPALFILLLGALL